MDMIPFQSCLGRPIYVIYIGLVERAQLPKNGAMQLGLGLKAETAPVYWADIDPQAQWIGPYRHWA